MWFVDEAKYQSQWFHSFLISFIELVL